MRVQTIAYIWQVMDLLLVNGFGGAVGVVARAKIKCKDYYNRYPPTMELKGIGSNVSLK